MKPGEPLVPREPLVPLVIWYPSPHEIGFGPALHAGRPVLARWADVAARVLFARFGQRPAWFLAEWERARTWAFPDGFTDERIVGVDGVEFHCARATAGDPALFAEMMRSADVGWDAVAVVDGTLPLPELAGVIRGWQASVNERESVLRSPADVMFTSGDGLVLRWANARRSADQLRAEVLALAGVTPLGAEP